MGKDKVQVVAFDNEYMLCAIFRSISEAASISKILRQSLIKAIGGQTISAAGMYWRSVPADIEVEPDDIGNLTLFEFDEMVGVDRKIYYSKNMNKSSVILESEYKHK